MTTPWRWLVFLLLLLPSAQFAWKFRDMPRFGYLHDDAILYGSAFSLAANGNYRIVSLPEKPYQTKYPPLYPAFLSLAWKLNPHFPENLALVVWFNWILMIPLLALTWALYRRHGFEEWQAVTMVAFLAISPTLILFSANAMTEIFFTCGLLVTLELMERISPKNALIAGLVAGCVYLSRTAGIALLISGPAWYLWKRSRTCALLFAGGMIPFVAGWMLWANLHKLRTADTGLLFYTDYLQFQFLNVGWSNFATVVAINTRELLYGIGTLVVPRIVDSPILRIGTAIAAFGMCAGLIRMIRQGIMQHYAAFAIVSLGILVVWHYPPNERFVLPLYPLLLAGLCTEIAHLGKQVVPAFKNSEFATRATAYALSAALTCALVAVVVFQLFGTFQFLTDAMVRERIRQAGRREVYAWLGAHVPPSAHVLSVEDPVLFFYTGLTGNTIPLLPRDWYANRTDLVANLYRNIASYCRSRNIDYFFFAPEDLQIHWTRFDDLAAIERGLRQNPELAVVHSTDAGTVYRIRPTAQ